MAKVKRSKEEVKAYYSNLKELSKTIKAMSEEEKQAFVKDNWTINTRGERLSLFNTIFLAIQAGKLVPQVGGFRQWKQLGKVVKKGEHAIGRIFYPLQPSIPQDKDISELDEGDIRMHFGVFPVFSVDQVEDIQEEQKEAVNQ